MSEFPYMPFYVGDYLGDTGHLDTLEHGAYCLIIFEYWKRGQGPKKEAVTLAKIARMSTRRWKSIEESILQFFEVTEDGRLWHSRIEEELEKAKISRQRRVDAGRAGGLAKAQHSSSNAKAKPQQCSSKEASNPELITHIKPNPLPQQAGESENEEEKPVPKNSRVHGTNPRALGTNPRAISGKGKADAERLAEIERKIDREIYDAWAEANACTPEESREAIRQAKIKAGWRVPEDEVVI